MLPRTGAEKKPLRGLQIVLRCGAQIVLGVSPGMQMGGRVIQGFFVGGGARPGTVQAALAGGNRTAVAGPPAAACARHAALPVTRAAAGGPGTPHSVTRVAQPQGGNNSFPIDPTKLGLACGRGQSLPKAVLAKMESAFDADFSGVRIHVGPQASRIGAVAFTMGDNIYFAPGRYQPDSIQGQQLLGHELAHVIQQRQGRVRAPGSGVSVVQDRALEAEADRLGARAAMRHNAVQLKPSSPGRFAGPVQPKRMIQPARRFRGTPMVLTVPDVGGHLNTLATPNHPTFADIVIFTLNNNVGFNQIHVHRNAAGAVLQISKKNTDTQGNGTAVALISVLGQAAIARAADY